MVGKTNTPEFASDSYTANRLFGVTRNPWAPDCSPGGSSGGSAAALAAGLAPIATATDAGSSVRIPAALSGLAGLKPTNGVIGRDPIGLQIDFDTPGPLAATIADLRLLLSVMAGPVAGDPTALPNWSLGGGYQPCCVLAAPRVGSYGPLPKTVQQLFEDALRILERDLGLPVEPIAPKALFEGGPNMEVEWHLVGWPELAHAVGREAIVRSAELMGPIFRRRMEIGVEIPIEDYLGARRRRFGYIRQLDELLGNDSILVTPTLCVEGWLADGRMLRSDVCRPEFLAGLHDLAERYRGGTDGHSY